MNEQEKDKQEKDKEIKEINKHINLLIKGSLSLSLLMLIIYLITLFV